MGSITITTIVLAASLLVAGCKSKPPVVVHTPITSKGCPAAFVSEHNDLMAENLRLKLQLKLLQERTP